MQVTRFPATYFDGKSPRRHEVTVVVASAGLRLIHADDRTALWPYEELKQTQGNYTGEELRFEHGLEAVVVTDRGILEAMHELAPQSDRRVKPAIGGWRMLRAALGAVVGLVVGGWGMYTYGLPALSSGVAAHVPVDWEVHMGDQALAQLVPMDQRCEDVDRVAALQTVVATLVSGLPAKSPYVYRVTITKSDEFNAFALPGGRLIVNQGLVKKLGSADELAGILAHEIQHVERRHTTKAICEEMSTKVLIAGLLGNHDAFGSAVNAARALGELGHSRQAEAEADHLGMNLMVASNLDPQAMVKAYRHLKEHDVRVPTFLSTHPDTDGRIASLTAMAREAHASPHPLALAMSWRRFQQGCTP
ncbi:MAG: putative Peptidase, family [Cyanobacteria bacterium RYN_339]|nr:putative Peptidase, family [Cyanobacteria bacterium RYN_339]